MSLVYVLAMLVALVAAFPGWLLSRPAGERRFTWRFIAHGALFVAMVTASVDHYRGGEWFWLATTLLAAWFFLGKTIHWWRAVERERKGAPNGR